MLDAVVLLVSSLPPYAELLEGTLRVLVLLLTGRGSPGTLSSMVPWSGRPKSVIYVSQFSLLDRVIVPKRIS